MNENEKKLKLYKNKVENIIKDKRFIEVDINDIEYNAIKIVRKAKDSSDINEYLMREGIDNIFNNIETKLKMVY